MKDEISGKVSELIRESIGEISGRIWDIYKRSKMDYVDKRDITAELLELYEYIEGTVRPFD